MAARHNSRERRWKPEQIRKALKRPKPQGAVAKAYQYEHGLTLGDTRQRDLLRWISEHADVVRAEPAGAWLLVPMPAAFLDELASFEGDADAELEEDDGGDDREPELDGGEDGEDEMSDQPAVLW